MDGSNGSNALMKVEEVVSERAQTSRNGHEWQFMRSSLAAMIGRKMSQYGTQHLIRSQLLGSPLLRAFRPF